MVNSKRTIYLDYAAATPVDERVLGSMMPYFTDKFYNPSALYLAGKDIRKDIDAARAKVASILGARPVEIVFTAGGTEANNLAIQGIMRPHPDANVVVSAIEHDSVLAPARQYNVKEAPVRPDGRVDVPSLLQLIDDNTVLVSVMYANNEIGTIQPLTEIGHAVMAIRHQRELRGNTLPLYLHTDACQAGNYLHLNVYKLGVDMMTLNGGKIYGPKQSGVLFVSSDVGLQAQNLGGGQEHGRRSGTENVAGIMGFSAALELAQRERTGEAKRLQGLQDLALRLIAKELPKTTVNGSHLRLPNNIHLTIPGQDNERLIMALDERGIQAAAGSACSASSDEPSHVLKAIGLSDNLAQASLRFTMGRDTDELAITTAIATLIKLVAR